MDGGTNLLIQRNKLYWDSSAREGERGKKDAVREAAKKFFFRGKATKRGGRSTGVREE